MKSVGLSIDIIQFTCDLKSTYSDISKVIRLKNQKQNDTKLVKLEFIKPNQRDEILSRGKIMVDSLTYVVEEYLAPARVLICSKCCGIGHFRKQCQQNDETCKVCGLSCVDLASHQCSQQLKCIHCGGNHSSNELKCPVVKEFRAQLTKRLLSIPSTDSHFRPQLSDFPVLNSAQYPTIVNNKNWYNRNNNDEQTLTKLNDIIVSISKLNDKIEDLSLKTDKCEESITQQNRMVKETEKQIFLVSNNMKEFNANIKQLEIIFKRHENCLNNVIYPILTDVIKFVVEHNQINGRPRDADLGYRLERLRNQLKNGLEGKNCL
ncbi:unnamed protein product [Didymodactylos carnosus]|uniref:CCHC-type domain-containing protein n=1 Tax=Didymodactylos carnosus TaxID=1234261 RepID=A0A8S2YAQ0_9BILA|nr:unnamed protein product [Didymodactylos carnosus]